jgi:long-chain acyl-CoA synthetase
MNCTGLAHGNSAAPSITAQTTTLRTCISGGASLPLEILRGFEEKFGCVILDGYGLA